jgi:ribose-phosphate pyrophosphokinase
VKLFGLEQTRDFATLLAAALGAPLDAHEERDFEDGEFKVRALASVAGERVAVCQSLSADSRYSASDKLFRLLFFCGSLKDAGAERVTAVVPYLAYARKDRRTKPADPVATRYVAQIVEAVGVDEIVTIDVHNEAALDNAFRIAKRNLEAADLFVERFAAQAAAARRTVVLSPDAGGVSRARKFAAALGERTACSVDLAFVEKHRSGGRVSGELFAGDVQGALVIVLDDMISSGTTIARSAAACRERRAAAVHAAATHGVFAPGAEDMLRGAALDSLTVTNTVPDAAARVPGLGVEVLDAAPIFARALR